MEKLPTIIEIEEVWSEEVECYLIEALKIYQHSKKICRRKFFINKFSKVILLDKNLFISSYIKTKCGKIRTPRQISSHLQVLKHKYTNKIHVRFSIFKIHLVFKKHPQINYLIIPQSIANQGFYLTNNGAVALRQPLNKNLIDTR